MPNIVVNRATGEYSIRGRFDPADFHVSSTGKTTLLVKGANVVVTGDAGVKGTINLYVKDVSTLVP